MTLSVLTAPLERDHAGADTRTAAIIEQQRSADELAAQRAAGGGASRGDQPAAHTQHTDACVLHHFGLLKSNCTIFFLLCVWGRERRRYKMGSRNSELHPVTWTQQQLQQKDDSVYVRGRLSCWCRKITWSSGNN